MATDDWDDLFAERDPDFTMSDYKQMVKEMELEKRKKDKKEKLGLALMLIGVFVFFLGPTVGGYGRLEPTVEKWGEFEVALCAMAGIIVGLIGYSLGLSNGLPVKKLKNLFSHYIKKCKIKNTGRE